MITDPNPKFQVLEEMQMDIKLWIFPWSDNMPSSLQKHGKMEG